MKLEMSTTNKAVVAILLLVVGAFVFWQMAVVPRRDQVAELDKQVETAKTSLALHEGEVVEAEAARDEFPVNYQQLVVLGKATPGDDDTASLLVQVNRVAEQAGVRFSTLSLSEGGGDAGEAPPEPAGGEPISPTEVSASLMPLGAAIGPAGLGVMPYSLTFTGSFFEIADFIKGLDSLVKTDRGEVVVDGRLLTIDGFSLESGADAAGSQDLAASFEVTTYLTPPSEGVTGGATPGGPGATEAAPVSTTTGAVR